MKEIKAFIQPFMLSKVVRTLQQIPEFPGMSISEVKGFGRGKAKGEPRRIIEDLVEYTPKVRIEIIAQDHMVDEIVTVIQKNAHTGNKGDGKVFVSNVENALRIRTGEKDEDAIWSSLKDE
jgi:nitrogen regulatory protein P-II 1